MMQGLEQLAVALEQGSIRSIDLIESCLARIADEDGEGARVFVKLHADQARAAAQAMDALRAASLAPSRFAGIPISVKDLFDMAGDVTCAGSTALADRAPATADAPAIARLKQAGFIVVGRTNMSEFAFSGLGLNPHYGTPKNPFDRGNGRIPGGSSSGAAVSVSDGMAAVGIGSDTGGSCRIPAALCGLVGFKPTASSVSRDGAVPLSTTLDTIGSLGKSVSCVQIIHSVMADNFQVDERAASVSGLRIAVPQSVVLDDLEPEVAATFASTLERLTAAGAQVTHLPFPSIAGIGPVNAKGGFSPPEAYAWHRTLIAEKGDQYDHRVLARILRGREQDAADYVELIAKRRLLIEAFEREFGDFDLIAFPTTPIVAPSIAELEADDALFARINMLMLRNSAVINMMDGCAISLPMHQAGTAPMGLTLAAKHGDDARLLRQAAAVEAVLR
jgi:aspartyl-tRNA(Asn)/glutamyl-tRNA(Gln) amidotransferase subunit A